jgi:hypothetical protein
MQPSLRTLIPRGAVHREKTRDDSTLWVWCGGLAFAFRACHLYLFLILACACFHLVVDVSRVDLLRVSLAECGAAGRTRKTHASLQESAERPPIQPFPRLRYMHGTLSPCARVRSMVRCTPDCEDVRVEDLVALGVVSRSIHLDEPLIGDYRTRHGDLIPTAVYQRRRSQTRADSLRRGGEGRTDGEEDGFSVHPHGAPEGQILKG